MSNMMEKLLKMKNQELKLTLILTNSKIFGFEEKMLLRFLDIVNHEMLLRDMYLITIKCFNCIGALKQGVNKITSGALKQGVNKMTLEENIVYSQMRLVFMNLYLVLSQKLPKDFVIGYLPQFFHQFVNMANTKCLIVLGIR